VVKRIRKHVIRMSLTCVTTCVCVQIIIPTEINTRGKCVQFAVYILSKCVLCNFSYLFALRVHIRGRIQKFPNRLPGAEPQMREFSATRCSCIVILWISLVNFAVIILCVTYQRVFFVVISLSTRSGNF